MKDLHSFLEENLGSKGWVKPENSHRWQRDWLDLYGEKPIAVARPKTTEQVSKVLKFCSKKSIPIVPQGGNTSLVGGAVLGSPEGLILEVGRMNKISSPDIESEFIEVEAGTILDNLCTHVEKKSELMFPMNIGSSGSAQIGGLIATNAGGCSSFRYGMMQDLVLGMEVVLSDGSIWNGMRAVQKDNTGYQLKKIFSGSEGTLGVITKAILKLSPKPKQCYTALLAIKDASALIEIKKQLRQEASEFLQAVEFFSDTGLEILLSNVSNINFPLKTRSPFYLLIEVGSSSEYVPLEKILSEIMEWGINKNLIMDGSLAMSISQQQNFWRLRDEQPEGQRRLGAQLKLDLSVPPGMLAHFLDHAATRCHKILPGVRINPFGHVGDGNVHYNLSPPVDQKDFLDLENELSEMLAELATDMRGSFAAEHGIGRSKIGLAKSLRCDIERKLMLNIKSSMDEANQLNPGVIVSKK